MPSPVTQRAFAANANRLQDPEDGAVLRPRQDAESENPDSSLQWGCFVEEAFFFGSVSFDAYQKK